MANTKDKVRGLLERLPDDCTLDDVMYRIYVLRKIDAGMRSLETEPAIPHAQAMKEVEEWLFKSAGPQKR